MSQTETRPTADRFPFRILAVWAVLGASATVALMYWPAVFEGRHAMWPDFAILSAQGVKHYDGPAYATGHVRVFGALVYEEQFGYDEPEQVVGRWHTRVTLGLAILGGLCGAVIGHLRGACRPIARTDRRLWLVVTVCVFGSLATAGVPGEQGPGLWTQIRFFYLPRSGPPLPRSVWIEAASGLGWELIRLGVPAVAIGWAAQVMAGTRGLRFPGGRRPEQAADYGEQARARGVP